MVDRKRFPSVQFVEIAVFGNEADEVRVHFPFFLTRLPFRGRTFMGDIDAIIFFQQLCNLSGSFALSCSQELGKEAVFACTVVFR